MDNPIPLGPENLICPFHRQRMSKVCHKCPLWTQLRGKNPQSNEEVDRWQCAVGMLPLLLVENAQMSRQTGAAVETLRNAVADRVPIPLRPSIKPTLLRPSIKQIEQD